MIELREVEKITDDLIQEFRLVKEDKIYECYLDDKKIGYGIIRKEPTNRIFLVIAKKYQNQGYGSTIFKLLLYKIDETVICSVPIENTKMKRIIENNNGIEIGRNGKLIQYIIDK